MFVQTPAPAAERWNWALPTPEPPSAEFEVTATELPRTFALEMGAVIAPGGVVVSLGKGGRGGGLAAVGLVVSWVKVRTVGELVFPTTSVEVTDSVGLFASPALCAKLFVVTYGPPAGALTVWVVCVQVPIVPPSPGKTQEPVPDPESATAFGSCKLPAGVPR